MSKYRVLANRTLAGPIEREELSGTRVKYTNVALLDRGVWTDAGSGQPTEYDPAELSVEPNAPVNIMHDSESEASEAGHIDAESWTVEGGTGYADVVLDLDTTAGQYADETLQETLESGGEVGFGGPSIEIPAQGYDLEETGQGYPKLVDGSIEGMGFVRDPASKSTSFSRQTAERGVAMSADSQNPMVYTPKGDAMSDELDLEALREQYNLSDDVDKDTIKELLEAGAMSLEDGEEDEEEEEDMENEEDEPPEDPEEEEAEEEEESDEMDMEDLKSEVAQLRSELETIREEHEAMMQAEEMESELAEAREELREELAAADTVAELESAKEDLDKRLAALEDEPKDPKSLSDNSDGDDWEPQYDTVPSEPAEW